MRVSDTMILIAGLAIVLTMGGHLLSWLAHYVAQACRILVENRIDLWQNWHLVWRVLHEPVRQIINYGFQWMAALIFGMTPVFFILRLKRPRPSLRLLLTQPGMVAALAMVSGLFWVLGLAHMLFPGQIDAMTGPWIMVGCTVAVAWAALALVRGWKAEPGWIDRLGRLLGAMAIGTALLGVIVFRV